MSTSGRKPHILSFSWRDFAIFCSLFTSAVLLCILLHKAKSSEGFAYSISILTVLLISRFTTGYLYGTLAAVLSVVVTNYIFTYPYWAVDFTLSGYPLTFLTMLLVSLVTCTMTTKIKKQENLRIEAAREKMKANLLRSVSHIPKKGERKGQKGDCIRPDIEKPRDNCYNVVMKAVDKAVVSRQLRILRRDTMDLADFFAIDRLAEHDEETLVESAMQLQQVMMLYESGIREIKTKLDILADESRISGKASPINAIKSRIKTPRSIVGKLKRRGFPVTLQSMMDNLNDIGGIRVICPFIQDIYTVADMLMRQTDLTLIEKKDYISSPKPNGYRSLHLILEVPIFLSERTVPVRIELQLRTIAMDFWASLEHQLRYKSNVEVPANLSDDLKRCADVIAATDEDMQRIAKDLGVL